VGYDGGSHERNAYFDDFLSHRLFPRRLSVRTLVIPGRTRNRILRTWGLKARAVEPGVGNILFCKRSVIRLYKWSPELPLLDSMSSFHVLCLPGLLGLSFQHPFIGCSSSSQSTPGSSTLMLGGYLLIGGRTNTHQTIGSLHRTCWYPLVVEHKVASLDLSYWVSSSD